MRFGKGAGFLISFLIIAVAGFILLLTGVWYAVIVAGLIGALLVRKGYAVSALSSFTGGLVSVGILLLTLPTSYLMPTVNEVASISGIEATLLLAVMFLITGLLALSGSLIGTFVVSASTGRNSGPT
jgi:hypothetical protein